MAISTASAYKTRRGITASGWDTVIGNLLDSAQAEIERLCGRTAGGFEAGTFTEYFDGDGSQVLEVSNGPISSITSIKVGNSDQTTLDASGYTFKERTILRIPFDGGGGPRRDSWGQQLPMGSRSPCFPEGFKNIEVVYSTSGEVTDDLETVLFKWVDHLLASRGRDAEKLTVARGNTNHTLRAIPDFDAWKSSVLRPWRRVR